MSLETLTPSGQPNLPPLILENPGEVRPVQEATVTIEQIQDVVKQFSPRSEVDDNGLNRTVFEHGDVTFAFVGREETPIYPTLESSQPTSLARESYWISMDPGKPEMEEESVKTYRGMDLSESQIKNIQDKHVKSWQEERDRLTGFKETVAFLKEKNSDRPEHLIVEQSAYGLFALLARLQPENPHWEQQRQEVANGKYDDEAILLIDMATALNAVGVDRSSGSADEHPPLGEAVVIAAILGDEEAQRLAQAAVQEQEERETAKVAKQAEELQNFTESSENLRGVEAFTPEDLVAVHATRFMPEVEEGVYRVQTTHDATGYPRASIHTSINHKVESHLEGNWDEAGYVLVAGLDKMLETNGPPNSINGADTWWTRNPGEQLAFPEATLIAPGGSQSELFVRSPDGQVTYKTEGITESDLELADELLGYGTGETIRESLVARDGQHIALGSEDGQRIARNIIRDALVREEITKIRGKQLLEQSDDKFMPQDIQARLDKMGAQFGAYNALHNSESDESIVEQIAATGKRISGFPLSDPKIRRTAYASGMMGAGGTARQHYESRKKWEEFPGIVT